MTVKIKFNKEKILKYDKPILISHTINSKNFKKLLIKIDNEFYLINHMCPHNGLPLINAKFYENGNILCNWHGCLFSIFMKQEIPKENIINSEKVNVGFESDEAFIEIKI
tara:strand:- start:81 stop:410 length:330 start_codon:yes stop_codon:yes gene_type:complete